jgi:hypothetical protein
MHFFSFLNYKVSNNLKKQNFVCDFFILTFNVIAEMLQKWNLFSRKKFLNLLRYTVEQACNEQIQSI